MLKLHLTSHCRPMLEDYLDQLSLSRRLLKTTCQQAAADHILFSPTKCPLVGWCKQFLCSLQMDSNLAQQISKSKSATLPLLTVIQCTFPYYSTNMETCK